MERMDMYVLAGFHLSVNRNVPSHHTAPYVELDLMTREALLRFAVVIFYGMVARGFCHPLPLEDDEPVASFAIHRQILHAIFVKE